MNDAVLIRICLLLLMPVHIFIVALSVQKSKVGFGAPCDPSIYDQCEGNLQCLDRKCICQFCFYHDGNNNCLKRVVYGETCKSSIKDQCDGNLQCLGNKCTCPATHYHKGDNECLKGILIELPGGGFGYTYQEETPKLKEAGYNSSCDESIPGQCSANLQCLSKRCTCSSSQYYVVKDKLCQTKVVYRGTCDSSIKLSQCSGNLRCLRDKCRCSFAYYYRGENECRRRKMYGRTCNASIERQCRGNLQCLGNKCTCPATRYFNGRKRCRTKRVYGSTCYRTSIMGQCGGNLQCLGDKCTCPSTDYFDGENKCQTKVVYNAPCDVSVKGQCDGNLQCLGNKCTCPSTHYYDGTSKCQTRVVYNAPCNTSIKSQCNGDLQCLGNKCTCPNTHYHDGDNKCQTKVIIGGTCTSSIKDQCRGPLQCLGNKCTCPSTHYFDGNDICQITPIGSVVDNSTPGGPWMIIQRRNSSDVNFYRNWKDYKVGFGPLDGNFWYGLDKIHQFCKASTKCKIHFDVGPGKYAEYSSFFIDDETAEYKLHISGYSGNAGDKMNYHNNMKFSTKDNDNDESRVNCVKHTKAAFWNKACNRVSLNGQWRSESLYHNMYWETYRKTIPYSIVKVARQ